jgi:hypothetical protein
VQKKKIDVLLAEEPTAWEKNKECRQRSYTVDF